MAKLPSVKPDTDPETLTARCDDQVRQAGDLNTLFDCIKLAGWDVVPVSIGWHVTPPGQDTFTVTRSTGGANLKNTIGVLRRHGLGRDMADALIRQQKVRVDALKTGREKADTKARQLAAQPPTVERIGTLAEVVGTLPAATFMPPADDQPIAAARPAQTNGTKSTLTTSTRPAPRPSVTSPEEMYTVTVTVTPELAYEWLQRPMPILSDGTILQQRRLKPELVNAIKGDIIRGDWRTTAQSIALAPGDPHNTGGVVDGQHRLYAIFDSGQAVEVRVTFNADPNDFVAYDIGGARTYGDMVAAMGGVNTAHTGSALKLLYAVEAHRGDPEEYERWSEWARLRATKPQIQHLYVEHPDLREHVAPGASMMRPARGIVAAGIVFRYMAMRDWPKADEPTDEGPGLLSAFTDSLRVGARIGHGPVWGPGHPCYTLKRWMEKPGGGLAAGDDPRRRAYKRETQYVALIKGWNLFCRGKEMGAVRVLPNEPVPEFFVPRLRSARG